MNTIYYTADMYIMNTRTRVPSSAPESNDFGHGEEESTFFYLEDAWAPGRKLKVASSYGDGYSFEVGDRVVPVNDTGMGLRSMPSHRIIGIKRPGQELAGTPELLDLVARGNKIAYWVFK